MIFDVSAVRGRFGSNLGLLPRGCLFNKHFVIRTCNASTVTAMAPKPRRCRGIGLPGGGSVSALAEFRMAAAHVPDTVPEPEAPESSGVKRRSGKMALAVDIALDPSKRA